MDDEPPYCLKKTLVATDSSRQDRVGHRLQLATRARLDDAAPICLEDASCHPQIDFLRKKTRFLGKNRREKRVQVVDFIGAGEGNRTLVVSLGSCLINPAPVKLPVQILPHNLIDITLRAAPELLQKDLFVD
jgi:hypothetical protein